MSGLSEMQRAVLTVMGLGAARATRIKAVLGANHGVTQALNALAAKGLVREVRPGVWRRT